VTATLAELMDDSGWLCARSIVRTHWDGETYCSGYDPFCTQRCGVAFAIACHNAGMRMVRKDARN
jgi:hypothetical protein